MVVLNTDFHNFSPKLGFKDEIEIVEQNRSLQLSPAEAPAGKPVTVSWTVPVDEATAMDWIGKKNRTLCIWYFVVPESINLYLCTLNMTSTQVVETSVINNNSQDYAHLHNKL